MAIYINEALCPQNHHCPLVNICPMEAIAQNGNELPEIDASKCIECGDCVKQCGMNAMCEKAV